MINAFPLPLAVAQLDLQNIKRKLLDPEEGAGLGPTEIALAELEYRRFLALHLLYPMASLVPNRLVDLMWHAHIMDTMRYSDDCIRLFGHVMHHDPYMGIDGPESVAELEYHFSETQKHYEKHFGSYPINQLAGVRCKGHACHAPSACACRVPGACKSVLAA